MTEPAPGQDLDALFDRVIAPALAPFEAERRAVLRRFWRFIIAGGVVGFAFAMITSTFGKDFDAAGVVIWTGIIAMIAAGFGYMPVHRFEQRCKARALEELAGALGMTYVGADFEPPAMERLQQLKLIGNDAEDSEYEDLFSGTRSGAAFQLYEAKLTKQNGKSTVTVFQGQVLRIAFPKKFLGVTIVNRDSQRWFKPKGFQKIGLESSQFERIFEVFGTDQVEARFLVHPAFMERLMALEAAMSGKNLRCAFDDSHLLVAVEGGDLFEVVDVFKPLPDREQTRKGLGELDAVLKLIDAILAPPPNVWAQVEKT